MATTGRTARHDHTYTEPTSDGPVTGNTSRDLNPVTDSQHDHGPGSMRKSNGVMIGTTAPGGSDRHTHTAT